MSSIKCYRCGAEIGKDLRSFYSYEHPSIKGIYLDGTVDRIWICDDCIEEFEEESCTSKLTLHGNLEEGTYESQP